MLLAQRDLLEFKVQEQEACADLEISVLGSKKPQVNRYLNELRGEQDVR